MVRIEKTKFEIFFGGSLKKSCQGARFPPLCLIVTKNPGNDFQTSYSPLQIVIYNCVLLGILCLFAQPTLDQGMLTAFHQTSFFMGHHRPNKTVENDPLMEEEVRAEDF